MDEKKQWNGLFGNKELARIGFINADNRHWQRQIINDTYKYRARKKLFEAIDEKQRKITESI